ncbi:MAG: hypothetical protein AAFO94_22710, partial [Bacteroidota bacterium]
IFVKSGRLVDPQGKPVSTKGTITAAAAMEEADMATFVMDENGRLYYTRYPLVTQFHHSSFLAGGPVAAAGEIQILNGQLKKINTKSGHYKPSVELVQQVLTELSRRGYNTKGLKVEGHGGPAPVANNKPKPGPSAKPAAGTPLSNLDMMGKISEDHWMTFADDGRSAMEIADAQFDAKKAALPEIKNLKEYVAITHGFLRLRPDKEKVDFHVKPNGDILLYHVGLGLFGAYNFEGKPYVLERIDGSTFKSRRNSYPVVRYKPDQSKVPAGLTGAIGLQHETTPMLSKYKGEDQGK